MKPSLPSRVVGDAAWGDAPPAPLDDPALYEGLWSRRVIGYLADAAILIVAGLCLWTVNLLTLGLLSPIVLPLSVLLPIAYHGLFIGYRAATPGMALMDIEIRSWTGRRPDYPQAVLATVLFYVSVVSTGWLILLVSLFNERRRTLHDYASGTLAVRRSRVAPAEANSA